MMMMSPTISSVSSSGFDTESTGSFFHDHSITLGALMGVPTITFRTPPHTPTITLGSTPNNRNLITRKGRKIDRAAERRRKRIKRNWWWLCCSQTSKPSKLWEFLEVERRFEVDGLFTDALMDVKLGGYRRSGPRRLFANGTVLPPPPHVSDINEGTPFDCSLSIEKELETAIYTKDGIRDSNFGDLNKIAWARSSRTDKGVHSLSTMISL